MLLLPPLLLLSIVHRYIFVYQYPQASTIVRDVTHEKKIKLMKKIKQAGQAIQLVGSQRPRVNQLGRQVQVPSQVKSSVLQNQLVTVGKPMTANQLILSGNKQVLTPIMGE